MKVCFVKYNCSNFSFFFHNSNKQKFTKSTTFFNKYQTYFIVNNDDLLSFHNGLLHVQAGGGEVLRKLI